MKLSVTQQHYMGLFYTKFHPNRRINTECTRKSSYKPLSIAAIELMFVCLLNNFLEEKSCTFYEDLTDCLVADIR